ncbi:progranulin-like [Stegodyphus dumicola]|uniref:progranulin-like n=1 Tax=Stegodyphus dumicola TaxID=202533 RepID=UPI0015AE6E1A|nr:progranulin-like [Stegodyphus dumicola]XP_035232784.1 progranulin-like [Stegodyphus dumicola]XP_035232785.1 progranulin-like [Stegodyphus dumicola]
MMLLWWLHTMVLAHIFHSSTSNFCDKHNICGKGYKCCDVTSERKWCCPENNYTSCCYRFTAKAPVKSHDSFRPHLMRLSKSRSKQDIKLSKDQNFIDFADAPGISDITVCDSKEQLFCAAGQTCCKTSGTWKCCPKFNGTCCENEDFCCATETTCQGSDILCQEDRHGLTPALVMNIAMKYIWCPGLTQICLDTDTCCLIGCDRYGCCPYTDAVCCADFIHCCPSNTVCDIKELRCVPM